MLASFPPNCILELIIVYLTSICRRDTGGFVAQDREIDMFQKIRTIDNRVVERVPALYSSAMDKLMIMATYAGTGAFVWWIVLAMPFLLSAEYREAGVILTVALGLNYLIGEIIIKKSVGRDRPSVLLPEEEMKITKPKDHSFPSGHSASSFCAFAVTLVCCPPFIWIPSLLMAATIAFSRIYLRVHYLSDVIGGVVLGLIDGVAISLLMRYVVLINVDFLKA